MSLESEFKSKLDELAKSVKSVKTGDAYIWTRAERVRDSSISLAASKTAVREIQDRIDIVLQSIQSDNIMEKLEEFENSCPCVSLVSKASGLRKYLSERRDIWESLRTELKNKIAQMETESSKQEEDRKRNAEKSQNILKKVQSMKTDALRSLKQARSINTTHFGRGPVKAATDRIKNVEECETSIHDILTRIKEFQERENTGGIHNLSREVGTYLNDCQAIKTVLLRKKAGFERDAISRQSQSESQVMDESYEHDPTHRRQDPDARQPKRPRNKFI